MGVKTHITLDEVNSIFEDYEFIELIPTSSGIIDTTYILSTSKKSYILKKYERDISTKIKHDIALLDKLKSEGLNVPTCIESKGGWYIYERLKGTHPKNTTTQHIQELARFLAKLHNHTSKMSCSPNIIQKDEISKLLEYTKKNFFKYYKKLECLNSVNPNSDGLIHGDIFKDNTVFHKTKIGVFDFIDSRCGSFVFDSAIALIGFGIEPKSSYYINLFIRTYNQRAPKKIYKSKLIDSMRTAANFYALKRVYEYKSTSRAQELIRLI